ncbi:hypothetical protein RB195_001173 [Necator americanus]
MNFQDDSHILSRLGILDSKDESPRKINLSPKKTNSPLPSEKDRFVEVSIDGATDTKSESDDDIFDRNSLLSPNKGVKIYRRKHDSSICVYLVLLLTYLAVGVSCPTLWIAPQSGKNIPYNFLFENSIGLLVGCLVGKFLCQRLNLVFLSFFATASLCSLSWIAFEFPVTFDGRVVSCLISFISGNILYVGLALWLVKWRGYNRKALFFYVLIALGSSIVTVTRNEPTLSQDSLGLLSHSAILHKRQADTLISDNSSIIISVSSKEVTSPKPRKPHVVEGIKTVETKSEQNEQMRKAAASNKTQTATSSPSDNSTLSSLNVPNDVQIPESTFTSGLLISPTTKVAVTAVTNTAHVTESSGHTSTTSSPSGLDPLNPSHVNIRMITIATTTAVAFYIIGSVFCCIPCSIVNDLKYLRLFDPSVAGLTAGCRIRVASLQITASFLEGLVELVALALSQQQNTANLLILHHIGVFVSRAVIMISDSIAYSLFGCCTALLCSSLGSVLLLMVSADSSFGSALVSIGTGTIGLLVFFHIEVRLSPRGGTQLDYFTFPSIIGRCLCAAFATLLPSVDANQMIGVILLGNGPLLVIFVLLEKSLRKAARLKEIMEYSSSPVLEAVGEYVSLIERDMEYDSNEEVDKCDGLTS